MMTAWRWHDADLLEEVDGSGVVHARREDEQQVVEQQRLVVQVELQRLVVQLDVRHLWHDICTQENFLQVQVILC